MKKALFDNIEKELISSLSKSEKTIEVAVAWFTNHKLYNVLCKQIEKGVSVTVVIINDPINNKEGGLDWQKFIKIGGNLHMSKYPKIMHHKFCIIDNGTLFNGSYNWTYYAERLNIENTVKFEFEEEILYDFRVEFDSLKKRIKKYKRVRKFSLEDLLEWQSNKVRLSYFSKELQYEARALKRKNPTYSSKLIDVITQLNGGEITKQLKSEQQQIRKIESQIISKEISRNIITPEINRVFKTLKNTQPVKSRRTATKITSRKRTYSPPIQQDYKRAKKLLNQIKKKGFQGDFGELRINLKWDTYDDLDLHLIDPGDNHIHYSKKEALCQNSKGMLDIDANAEGNKSKEPEENIFWQENPPTGIYKIYVKHYSKNEDDEVPFILSIISKKGKSKIMYGKVHHTQKQTVLVAEFQYEASKGVKTIKELMRESSI